jgi:hypothetical protein
MIMRNVLLLLLCSTIACCLQAQDRDVILENLAREHDFTGQDLEDMLDARINLNQATKDDLEATGLLTPYQIASLLDYRQRYGNFISWPEVFLIPGFTEQDTRLLALFLTLEPAPTQGKLSLRSLWREGRRSLLVQTRTFFPRGEEYSPITAADYQVRPNSRYLGVPWYRYLRYDYRFRNRVRWGITLESDPGERQVADFLSFHAEFRDLKPFRSLVIGDFRARFGQGLLLWNGTQFGKASSTASLCNKEMGITPYRSRDENLFFRGLGATIGKKNIYCSVFLSFRSLDARITDEGFTSLVETGYHRTPLEKDKKNALGSWAAGINLSWSAERWKAGVTALGYGYDHQDAGRITYYNACKNRSVPFGGLSADMSFRLPSWRFFSEVAMDFSHSPAALAGMIYYGQNGNQAGILLRYFTPSYTAAYSGRLGRNTSPSNEYSLQITGTLVLPHKWKMDMSAWAYLFPRPRYLCHDPSYGWDVRLQVHKDNHMLMFAQQRSISDKGILDKPLLSLRAGVRLPGAWLLKFRADGVYCMLHDYEGEWGLAAYAQLEYENVKDTFRGSFRISLFRTESWESRIYVYEPDVLYGYSVPALFGKGIRACLNIGYSPLNAVDLWLKISAMYRESFFCESKLQVRFRF